MDDGDKEYIARAFARTNVCRCGWVGATADLIVTDRPGGLRCPKCMGDSTAFLTAPSTETRHRSMPL